MQSGEGKSNKFENMGVREIPLVSMVVVSLQSAKTQILQKLQVLEA